MPPLNRMSRNLRLLSFADPSTVDILGIKGVIFLLFASKSTSSFPRCIESIKDYIPVRSNSEFERFNIKRLLKAELIEIRLAKAFPDFELLKSSRLRNSNSF